MDILTLVKCKVNLTPRTRPAGNSDTDALRGLCFLANQSPGLKESTSEKLYLIKVKSPRCKNVQPRESPSDFKISHQSRCNYFLSTFLRPPLPELVSKLCEDRNVWRAAHDAASRDVPSRPPTSDPLLAERSNLELRTLLTKVGLATYATCLSLPPGHARGTGFSSAPGPLRQLCPLRTTPCSPPRSRGFDDAWRRGSFIKHTSENTQARVQTRLHQSCSGSSKCSAPAHLSAGWRGCSLHVSGGSKALRTSSLASRRRTAT